MIAINSNIEIRKILRDKRRNLTDAEKKAAAKRCFSHFLTLPIFSAAQKIAFYQPFDGEMDTAHLIQYVWQQQKECYLPVISKSHALHFFPYFSDSFLTQNQYAIWEPSHSHQQLEVDVQDLDLIVLPLVAFDHLGNRLGLGKGYYDKTLYTLTKNRKNKKPFLLGLAYHFQQVEAITTHEKDVKLDGVLTDKEWRFF